MTTESVGAGNFRRNQMAAEQRRTRTGPAASTTVVRALAVVLAGGALAACGQGVTPAGEYVPPTPVSVSRAVTSTSTEGAPSVRVSGLSDGDRVKAEQEIRGTAAGLSRHLQLWVVVRDVRAGVFRPQDDAISPETWGNWSVRARFGGEKARGGRYEVLVVAATTKAGNVFYQYLYATAGKDGPGLEDLPRGVRTLADVTVTRS